MKSAVIIVLVLCLISMVASHRGRVCKNQKDCNEDECCSAETSPAKCHKLGREGADCYPNKRLNFEDGKYLFMCPCAKGFTCGSKSVRHAGMAKVSLLECECLTNRSTGGA